MRGNKFEKSHIHILEPETLSREYKVTESAQEIIDSTKIANSRPMFTSCQHLYTLGEELNFTRKWEGFRREHQICGTLYFLRI